MRLQERVYEIVEVSREGDRSSRAFDIFIVTLISLNVVSVVLETVDKVYSAAPELFRVFEIVSVAIFTIEYLLRVWSCSAAPVFSGALRGRLRFMATPFAVIDLLAILPFYITGIGFDLRVVRVLRFLRIFRVAKLGRYSASLQLFGRVLSGKRYELFVTFSVGLMLLIVSSCLIYYAEHEAQPEAFASIPESMWWGVVTLTTVGYGDTVPVTIMGRLIAAAMAIVGIGMFALPAGILGAAFLEELHRKDPEVATCPHCGRQLTGKP